MCVAVLIGSQDSRAQSADWQEVVWREPQVRYLLAEMQLAGTKEKIASFGHRFHDYNCLVAVAHFGSGDRVANLDRFEFNAVDGKPGVSNVVYRGTGRRAASADIRLNSDLPNP